MKILQGHIQTFCLVQNIEVQLPEIMYCRIYFLYTVSLILFFTTPPVVGDINIINKKYFKYLLVS